MKKKLCTCTYNVTMVSIMLDAQRNFSFETDFSFTKSERKKKTTIEQCKKKVK
jgi:hypothetical protein